MKYNCSYLLICSALLFVVVPYCVSAQSDRIAFREPLGEVHDSIAAMNVLMNKLAASDEKKSYFFDKHQLLFINNRKVGRIPKDPSINFLGLMAVQTDLSQRECRKFLALSMFLKRNFMNGCIRHDRYGVYFYIYQPTGKNQNSDFRYIVLYDEKLINMTGTDEAESFTVLDRQKDLLLLLPAAKKK